MAERSNATDSRSVLYGGAGSNPADVILSELAAIFDCILRRGSQVRVLSPAFVGVAQLVEQRIKWFTDNSLSGIMAITSRCGRDILGSNPSTRTGRQASPYFDPKKSNVSEERYRPLL